MSPSLPLTNTIAFHSEEAPTPTISNRASPNKLPPALHLTEPTAQSSTSPKARFSSSTGSPIEVQRPLLHQKIPSSLVPNSASNSQYTKKRKSKLRVPRSKYPNDPRNQSIVEYLSLSLTYDTTSLVQLNGDNNIASFSMMCLCQMVPCVLDILKTNIPWKVFQNVLVWAWQRYTMSTKDVSLGIPGSLRSQERRKYYQHRRHVARVEQLRQRIPKRLFSNEFRRRQGCIQGIPNFGQTCFMNSVLQSLASLEPFLAYLDRIQQVHWDQVALKNVLDEESLSSASPMCLSRELLDLLLASNGIQGNRATAKHHHHLKVDPRGILKHIGDTHKQFKKGGDQQDAQEYLQALLGMVIAEAQLDCTSASSDHMTFHGTSLSYSDEDTMTLSVSSMEKCDSDFIIESPLEDTLRLEISSDEALSLSGFLEQMEEGRKHLCEKSGNEHSKSQNRDVPSAVLEEKKQEDFEIDAAHIVSHDLSLSAVSTSSQVNHDSRELFRGESEWDESSMAMKIVQTTLSSNTPSPLSGWLGSTIQCCRCQHIRPIQNSQFLDIPLVPRAVPAFFESMQKDVSPANHPQLPPCSIEECLSAFTSIERVQDVECRHCTVQSLVQELAEEEMLLIGALASIEKRNKIKGDNQGSENTSLKKELCNIQTQLYKLQTMDPDDESIDIFERNSDEEGLFSGAESLKKNSRLLRGVARKCLFLTRCPAVLCCHIQRRYYDPFSDRMEKCSQKVLFSEFLNLAPYCAYSPEGSSAWVAGISQSHQSMKGKRQEMSYRLTSIIEHRGNAHGGHYICYRRFGSSWFRVSDNNVSPVPWNHVRACEAYMLFYEAI